VDPQGELRPGDVHRIPFDIVESDVSMDVVAICPLAPFLEFVLEAPDGTLIQAGSGPNVGFRLDGGDEFYRIQLPAIPANPGGTHAGRWTAILRVRDPQKTAAAAGREMFAGVDRQTLDSVAQRGALPYQLFVQSYSNLTMDVEIQQDGFLPGAKLAFFAGLQEYRQPVVGPARVLVELVAPDGQEVSVQLSPVAPGRFVGEYKTPRSGMYRCRFRASGTSRRGQLFQREESRTAVINARLGPGGDLETTVVEGSGDENRKHWCDLVECLLHEPSVARLLTKYKIDAGEIRACLKRYCAMGQESKAVSRDIPGRLPMVKKAKRLSKDLTAVQAEVRMNVPLSSVPWDELLKAAPRAKAVVSGPQRPAPDAHAAHHNQPLPAMVTDDDGTVRLILPGGHREGGPEHHHEENPPPHQEDDHTPHRHGEE
jgi:hypothetical protein